VTIYLSQNQVFEKLDISSTFSKSVPEIIGYIHPGSDISDIAQFSREFQLSQNLSDISSQDRTYPSGRIYLTTDRIYPTLGFLAYKKASRTPSTSSSLFLLQLLSGDQEATPATKASLRRFLRILGGFSSPTSDKSIPLYISPSLSSSRYCPRVYPSHLCSSLQPFNASALP
jgi:hypothetical protein